MGLPVPVDDGCADGDGVTIIMEVGDVNLVGSIVVVVVLVVDRIVKRVGINVSFYSRSNCFFVIQTVDYVCVGQWCGEENVTFKAKGGAFVVVVWMQKLLRCLLLK
jgi:hypothetical protein